MNGVDAGLFIINMLACAAAALAALLVAFTVGMAKGRHRGVDVAWGLGFCVVALTAYGLSQTHGDTGRRELALLLVLVWGLRLSLHIAVRSRGKGEDPRYESLLSEAAPRDRDSYALRRVYVLQAALVWFISLPVQFTSYVPHPLGTLAWVGTGVWAVGLVFEAVGDWQLVRFTGDPANDGEVMDRGLWRFTRHPNYFGDACVWWGLFLLAADSPAGWVTVLSPLVMTALLVKVSGKPLLEKRLRSTRPGYADYVARTSGFVPMPPRRRRQ